MLQGKPCFPSKGHVVLGLKSQSDWGGRGGLGVEAGSRRGRLSCRYSGQCSSRSLLPSLAGGDEAAVAFTWAHTTGLCRVLGRCAWVRAGAEGGGLGRAPAPGWSRAGGVEVVVVGVQPLSLQPLGQEPTSGVLLAPFQLTR